MKNIPNEIIIIFKVLKYCILGIILGLFLIFCIKQEDTYHEKEVHYRDSVNKAWHYKNLNNN